MICNIFACNNKMTFLIHYLGIMFFLGWSHDKNVQHFSARVAEYSTNVVFIPKMFFVLLLASKIEFAARPLVTLQIGNEKVEFRYKLEVKKLNFSTNKGRCLVQPPHLYHIERNKSHITGRQSRWLLLLFRIFMGFAVWPSLSLLTYFLRSKDCIFGRVAHLSKWSSNTCGNF